MKSGKGGDNEPFSVKNAGAARLVKSNDGMPKSKGRDDTARLGNSLKKKVNALFGRSLHIREVDAGSCNACELEISALNNPIYDLERFGISFVASPRHADMLMVTGPVSRNMEIPLIRAYKATPEPKLVMAVGSCAFDGGIFGDTFATTGGVAKVIPVDVYIPGCPPRPQAILHGLLTALGKLDTEKPKKK